MFFPNFDPFNFARMSPRQRMTQQLQGRGLGNTGLLNMTQAGHGQIGTLVATNRLNGVDLDAGGELDFESAKAITEFSVAPLSPSVQNLRPVRQATRDAYSCVGVICPAGQRCYRGACFGGKGLGFFGETLATKEGTVAPSSAGPGCEGVVCPTGSHCEDGGCYRDPAVSIETTDPDIVVMQEAPVVMQEASVSEESAPTSYSRMTLPLPEAEEVGVMPESTEETVFASGRATSADAYTAYVDSGEGDSTAPPAASTAAPVAARPASIAQQAAAVMAQPVAPSGIPWGLVLGGVVVGFAAFKLWGK